MINRLLTFIRDTVIHTLYGNNIKSGEDMNTRKMREMHYTLVDERDWKWKYFTPKELACKGTGLILVDFEAIDKLEELRDILGVPFSPNSAYRSESHNKAVGGAKNSMHRLGRAFDIPIKGKMTRACIKVVADHVGFTGIGDYDTFVHVDTGKRRYWDMRTGDKIN